MSKAESAPTVTVIVPAYNAAKYLKDCLQSILGQTWKNIQLLAVYVPSSDNTLDVIHQYARADSRVEVVFAPKGASPAVARNTGIHKARGDYIAFCDADDYWESSKLVSQMRTLRDNADTLLTYTDVCAVSYLAERTMLEAEKWNREDWAKRPFICFSSVLLRRPTQIKELLMNEDRSLYGVEDFDLLLRLSERYKFARTKGYLTHYRRHPRQISSRPLIIAIAKSKVLLSKKMWKPFVSSLVDLLGAFIIEHYPPGRKLHRIFVKAGLTKKGQAYATD